MLPSYYTLEFSGLHQNMLTVAFHHYSKTIVCGEAWMALSFFERVSFQHGDTNHILVVWIYYSTELMVLYLEKCNFLSASKNRKGFPPWLFAQLTLSRRKVKGYRLLLQSTWWQCSCLQRGNPKAWSRTFSHTRTLVCLITSSIRLILPVIPFEKVDLSYTQGLFGSKILCSDARPGTGDIWGWDVAKQNHILFLLLFFWKAANGWICLSQKKLYWKPVKGAQ